MINRPGNVVYWLTSCKTLNTCVHSTGLDKTSYGLVLVEENLGNMNRCFRKEKKEWWTEIYMN